MAASSLDEISHREIILTMILLKKGDFSIDDLYIRLKRCAKKHPRLKITTSELENTFFFNHPFLCGEMSSPNYKLNSEGRRRIHYEFDKYEPRLQEELRNIGKELWDY